MTDQKIIDLEIKISHLENTIEDLSKEIFAQLKKIDELTYGFKKVSDILKQNSLTSPDIGPADEKPPHY